MNYLPPVLQAVLAVVVLIAAYFDFRWRRIPNWLVLSGLLVGIALNAFLYEWAGLRGSLEGLGLGLLIYLPLYALRGMGAGDVKLMAAVGALVGWRNWIGVFMLTAITGGLVALLLVVLRGRARSTMANVGSMFQQMAHLQAPYTGNPELDVKNPKAVTLPHGVMIAVGSIEFLIAAALWAPR